MRSTRLTAAFAVLALAACAQPPSSSDKPSPASDAIVGPVVHVSAERPKTEHVELVADGDSVHPGRLIACSMVQTRPVDTIRTAAYVSTDGGKTWSGRVFAPEGSWDPDCHIASDGTMYFASNAGQDAVWDKLPSKEKHKRTYIELWKSTDGGAHFTGPMNFAKGLAEDREWTAIDASPQSRYRGRIYAWYFAKAAPYHQNQPGGMAMENQLIYSKDGGKTWSASVKMDFRANDDFLSHGVVSPDGTLVLFETRVTKQEVGGGDPDRTQHVPDAILYATVSRDGGATVSAPIKIADVRIDQAINTRTVPTIAVDSSKGPFAGRLYVTWGDTTSGRSVIMASHSNDNAKTWSTPTLVDDDFWNKNNELGPDDFMPTVTVNNSGVVGMMWYDRRNDPDDVGYDVRFSSSLDGGDTWSPSVPVPGAHNSFETNEYPVFWPDIADGSKTKDAAKVTLEEGTWYIGGHTAGIGATADGVFHPVWADNHTRVQQLWTAPIAVHGSGVRNGDPQLASLADVTKSVHVEIQHPVYDRPSGTITVQVHLQNASSKRLRMPLYLRAISWNSDIGLAAATNADNKQSRPGAFWRFGNSGAMLAPHASTPWRTLTFHVSDVQSLHRDHQYYNTFLSISARVLGSSS